jgi:hypothetical protein
MTNDDRVEETKAGATIELGGTDEFETVDELLLIESWLDNDLDSSIEVVDSWLD